MDFIWTLENPAKATLGENVLLNWNNWAKAKHLGNFSRGECGQGRSLEFEEISCVAKVRTEFFLEKLGVIKTPQEFVFASKLRLNTYWSLPDRPHPQLLWYAHRFIREIDSDMRFNIKGIGSLVPWFGEDFPSYPTWQVLNQYSRPELDVLHNPVTVSNPIKGINYLLGKRKTLPLLPVSIAQHLKDHIPILRLQDLP